VTPKEPSEVQGQIPASLINRNTRASLPLSDLCPGLCCGLSGEGQRLEDLHLDDLANARDGEVVLANRTDHDRAVGTSLFVDTLLSFDPRPLDDKRAVGVGASFVGHIVSL
jgi:hypothetical protein